MSQKNETTTKAIMEIINHIALIHISRNMWQDLSFKEFGQPILYGLAGCIPHGHSLWLAVFIACDVLVDIPPF